MGFCVSCGKEMDEESRFCHHCGTPAVSGSGAGDASAPDPFKTVVKGAPTYGVVNLEQLPDGHVIDDRYEVAEKLGQGGFGAVYRVYDRKMECEKALKVLPEAVVSDRKAMISLKKEAVTMAKLNHPGIVRVFDFQDTGAVSYIDMEFVEGKSLGDALLDHPNGCFSEAEALPVAAKLADALAEAHKQGVIHRDIKPQNILMTPDGDVKLTDFGISETVKSSMSRIANSGSSGTLAYMSPEQLRGKDVGRESDIYSFGAVLYELLSGNPPFYRGDIAYQVLNEEPEPIKGVDGWLSDTVVRCLKKDYRDRFSGFLEVTEALAGEPEQDSADAQWDWDALRDVQQAGAGTLDLDAFEAGRRFGDKTSRSWVTRAFIGLAVILAVGLATFFYVGRQTGVPNRSQAHPPASRGAQSTSSARLTDEKGQVAKGAVAQKAEKMPGRLYVSATPSGAVVKVLNIKPKFFQGMKLAPGRYHVEVSSKRHETLKKWVSISEGEPLRLSIALKPLQRVRSQASSETVTSPVKAYGRFMVTSNTYKDSSDWDAAVREEFGPSYKVADWNDIKRFCRNGGDLPGLLDHLGLTKAGDSGFVRRNGKSKYSSNRWYYISRHNHSKPGYYLAHENIDDYLLSLGSWNTTLRIVAVKKR